MKEAKKVAVITCGAGELGMACAFALAERDVCVALIDEAFDQSSEKLAELVAADQAMLIECSLVDIPAIQAAVESAADHFGSVDVLVNCALEQGPDGFWEVEEEAFQRCVRVNMKMPFFALQACVPHMRAAGAGRVINMSSPLSATTDGYSQIIFGMTKAGINSMTRQWSVDLCLDNIQANSLWVDTEGEILPEEIAKFVAYVALNATPYLNGAQIPVDAGAYLFKQGAMLA